MSTTKANHNTKATKAEAIKAEAKATKAEAIKAEATEAKATEEKTALELELSTAMPLPSIKIGGMDVLRFTGEDQAHQMQLSKNEQLNDHEQLIAFAMKNVNVSRFVIARSLLIIKEKSLFKARGFDSIGKYAFGIFGMSATICSQALKVADFLRLSSEKPMTITDKNGIDLSYTQVLEIANKCNSDRQYYMTALSTGAITASTTCKAIREDFNSSLIPVKTYEAKATEAKAEATKAEAKTDPAKTAKAVEAEAEADHEAKAKAEAEAKAKAEAEEAEDEAKAKAVVEEMTKPQPNTNTMTEAKAMAQTEAVKTIASLEKSCLSEEESDYKHLLESVIYAINKSKNVADLLENLQSLIDDYGND